MQGTFQKKVYFTLEKCFTENRISCCLYVFAEVNKCWLISPVRQKLYLPDSSSMRETMSTDFVVIAVHQRA